MKIMVKSRNFFPRIDIFCLFNTIIGDYIVKKSSFLIYAHKPLLYGTFT